MLYSCADNIKACSVQFWGCVHLSYFHSFLYKMFPVKYCCVQRWGKLKHAWGKSQLLEKLWNAPEISSTHAQFVFLFMATLEIIFIVNLRLVPARSYGGAYYCMQAIGPLDGSLQM